MVGLGLGFLYGFNALRELTMPWRCVSAERWRFSRPADWSGGVVHGLSQVRCAWGSSQGAPIKDERRNEGRSSLIFCLVHDDSLY